MPEYLPIGIGKEFLFRIICGRLNPDGDDFADAFAGTIGAEHRHSPLGLADVTLEQDGCAWSVKTVQAPKPFSTKQIRLIAGRNSPSYSGGVKDPFADIQSTGRLVLEIYNARIDEALSGFSELRLLVLIRNMRSLQFSIFEREIVRFSPAGYTWSLNSKENFEGRNSQGVHCFTWQPHGSQFTIIQQVPSNCIKFELRRPQKHLDRDSLLTSMGIDDSWVITV